MQKYLALSVSMSQYGVVAPHTIRDLLLTRMIVKLVYVFVSTISSNDVMFLFPLYVLWSCCGLAGSCTRSEYISMSDTVILVFVRFWFLILRNLFKY